MIKGRNMGQRIVFCPMNGNRNACPVFAPLLFIGTLRKESCQNYQNVVSRQSGIYREPHIQMIMQAYHRILVALDGSSCSDLAAEAASQFVLNGSGISLTGCHVYSAGLRRSPFF